MEKESAHAVAEKDRFVSFIEKTMTVVRENRNKVILAASGVVLLLAVIAGGGLYKQKADRDASLAFRKVKADFQSLEEGQGRGAALTQWVGEAPGVLGRLKGSSATHDAALLWYGGLAYEHGDFQAATEWFGSAARGFSSDSALRNIALCGQGESLEQLGKAAEAVSLYEKIRKSGASVKREEATFHLARIKESQGDLKGAEVLYREIAESASASLFKDLAAEKVAGL